MQITNSEFYCIFAKNKNDKVYHNRNFFFFDFGRFLNAIHLLIEVLKRIEK